MQAIAVTASFAPDGKITPLRFCWRGGVFPVASTGRRWQEQDGYHILVMVASGQIFELLFSGLENRWYLVRPEPDHWAV
jgi:hypothetical protein